MLKNLLLKKKLKKKTSTLSIKNSDQLFDEGYISSNGYTLNDPEFLDVMAAAPWNKFARRLEYEDQIAPEFKKKVLERLNSTQINRLTGLERFQYQDVIHGVTQAFDEIFYRYNKRKLRIFRGEYSYHRRSFPNYEYLDTWSGKLTPLDQNDFIIVSIPFAGNGNQAPHLNECLDECHKKNIPVMIDCAWFGTCYDMDFDFNHPAITEVSFSLSKGLGVGKIRSGIRYSNFKDDPFPIRHQNDANYLPLIAMQLGMYMMEKISIDKIPNRYKNLQKELCQYIHLDNASKCIHVASPSKSSNKEYPDKYACGSYYRLGIKNTLKALYQEKIKLS